MDRLAISRIIARAGLAVSERTRGY